MFGGDFSEDLGTLVADVTRNIIRHWGHSSDLVFAWMLDGDEEAMHDAAAAAGVTLPDRPPAQSDRDVSGSEPAS